MIEGKKKLMQELRDAAKKVDTIYLAADPDREGEAICWHLQEELKSEKDRKRGRPKFFRVMFNEITKKSIEKAFEKPAVVNINLVDAQQARRVLDRLVGYKISPLLWDKVRRGLSAGRVQTVAVRVIVEREREIRAFVKTGILDARRQSGGEEEAVLRCAADSGTAKKRRNRGSGGSRTRWWPISMAQKFIVKIGRDEREAAQSGCSVHHFHAAAGVVAQTALQREAHHGAGAAAL